MAVPMLPTNAINTGLNRPPYNITHVGVGSGIKVVPAVI